ncbi:MAG: hypothetical protein QXO58_06090 [Thermoplasmata archaeon]
MDIIFQISAIIGIAPAFVLLYFIWNKFENFFDEKLLFFNLVMGLIIGTFVAAVFLLISYSSSKYIDLSIIFIITFAFFSELIKFLFLNRKRTSRTYIVTFNGMTFGLGIGAIWAVALTYYYSRIFFDIYIAFYFVIMSFAFSLIHSSTGAMIGYGIYVNRRMKYLFNAILIIILFNFTLLPYIWGFPPYYSVISLIIAVPIFYYLIYNRILIDTLPQELKRKWRKRSYEK